MQRWALPVGVAGAAGPAVRYGVLRVGVARGYFARPRPCAAARTRTDTSPRASQLGMRSQRRTRGVARAQVPPCHGHACESAQTERAPNGTHALQGTALLPSTCWRPVTWWKDVRLGFGSGLRVRTSEVDLLCVGWFSRFALAAAIFRRSPYGVVCVSSGTSLRGCSATCWCVVALRWCSCC